MKKLVIDESKWLRGAECFSDGYGINESALLHEASGKMCCLGFYALELGMTAEEIRGKGLLTEVLDYNARTTCGISVEIEDDEHYRLDREDAIVAINDNRDIDDATRKERLAPHFAAMGWELEFIPGDGK